MAKASMDLSAFVGVSTPTNKRIRRPRLVPPACAAGAGGYSRVLADAPAACGRLRRWAQGRSPAFAAQSQEALALHAANAPAIARDRLARLGGVSTIVAAAGGFRDVAPIPTGSRSTIHLVAVVALVATTLRDRRCRARPARSAPRLNQCLDARRRITFGRILHSDRDDGARLDGVFGFMRQVRACGHGSPS
jgi:hypothetical protein